MPHLINTRPSFQCARPGWRPGAPRSRVTKIRIIAADGTERQPTDYGITDAVLWADIQGAAGHIQSNYAFLDAALVSRI